MTITLDIIFGALTGWFSTIAYYSLCLAAGFLSRITTGKLTGQDEKEKF